MSCQATVHAGPQCTNLQLRLTCFALLLLPV
jgi:hypothetical protein